MFDIAKVAELIQHQIGKERYQANVMYIAELLSQISPETIPELQDEGGEEYIAERVVKQMDGVGRAVVKQADLLTQRKPASLDNLAPTKIRQTEEGITEITHFGPSTQDKRYAMRDRLSKLQEIKEILLHDKDAHLTAISSGMKGETANDWMADATGRRSLDQDSVFMRNQIEEVRKLSRANVKAHKVQQKLRDLNISKEDLLDLPPAALYDKYEIEKLGIKNDGKFRMRLVRLRKEML